MTDSPRVRSENRAVRGYGIPKDSKKTPDGFRGNGNPGGVGRGRDSSSGSSRFDYDAFIAEHFPDERYGAVRQATFHVIARHHHRQDPTPAAVRDRMVELGTTREQETEPKGTR